MSDSSNARPAAPQNVDQQHTLAKDLLREARANEPAALARLRGVFADRDAFRLADAQLVIAREAGLDSWPKLIEAAERNERQRWLAAIRAGDADAVRRMLRNSEHLRTQVNAPLGDFGKRPLHVAGSDLGTIDALLEFGAAPNLKSDWANGPYTPLDGMNEAAVRHLMSCGATLTPNVASRLGWIDALRAMLDDDPSLAHARGGDGQTPLHEAANVAIVDLLLDRGADVDARCIDHHSTPAMYALMARRDVCRRLIERGASADLFQAAQLGDEALARRLIAADPSCLTARVNLDGYPTVPKFSIYCWTIGWYISPLQLARRAGHATVAALIESRSDARQRLLDAAWNGDRATADEIVRADPAAISRVTPQEHGLLAAAIHLNRPDVVKLMLDLGFDPNARANDGGTALHQASWIGSAELVELLLATRRCAINDRGDEHRSPPLGWAAHGSVHCGHGPRQYEAVVRQLVAAGAELFVPGNLHDTPLSAMADGNPTIVALLRELGAR